MIRDWLAATAVLSGMVELALVVIWFEAERDAELMDRS